MATPKRDKKTGSVTAYARGAIVPSEASALKVGSSPKTKDKTKARKKPKVTYQVVTAQGFAKQRPKLLNSTTTCYCLLIWSGSSYIPLASNCEECELCENLPIEYMGDLVLAEIEGTPKTACGCNCCDVSGSLTRNGVLVGIDGNCVLANDYPASGGPWGPGFTNAGDFVWINHGD